MHPKLFTSWAHHLDTEDEPQQAICFDSNLVLLGVVVCKQIVCVDDGLDCPLAMLETGLVGVALIKSVELFGRVSLLLLKPSLACGITCDDANQIEGVSKDLPQKCNLLWVLEAVDQEGDACLLR